MTPEKMRNDLNFNQKEDIENEGWVSWPFVTFDDPYDL